MRKPVETIKGFDDVGIGAIWRDEGKGAYIRCCDLEGYDLTGIQIYRYSNFFRIMCEVDSLKEDSNDHTYCVLRKDLMQKKRRKARGKNETNY